MKNQYFGDSRDCVKYSLIVDILDNHREFGSFVFIPMLTRDDESPEGNTAGNPKKTDSRVYEFFEKTLPEKSVSFWRDFFRDNYPPSRLSYNHGDRDLASEDDPNTPFFDATIRGAYFDNLSKEVFRNALVFVDPDIGMQPENRGYWNQMLNHNPGNVEKYIFDAELENLFQTLDDSVLMVFQYLQFNKHMHLGQAAQKREHLRRIGRCYVSSVRCDTVQYLFATKSSDMYENLNTTLDQHANDRGLTFEKD